MGNSTKTNMTFALIPEAYLTTPFLFPFPSTSRNIVSAGAIHGITEHGQLISRVLPDECCWFAHTGHAINRIPDGLATCAALLECSRHSSEREWIQQKAPVAHPMEYAILLGNRNVNHERITSDHNAQRNYVIVDAVETGDRDTERVCGNEAVNLKIDRDQNSLIDSSMRETAEKKN